MGSTDERPSATSPPAADTVLIRAEQPEDRDAVTAVVSTAFDSAEHGQLVDAIRASRHFIAELSLVAERDGEIVGHVMISHAELHDGEAAHRVVTLSPLAVRPDRQRQGIGSALVRDVVAEAERLGEPLVLVEGDPRFYARFGFEPAAPHGIAFTLPSWAPEEAGQVLRLTGYDPEMRGRVVYPSAFDVVGEA